MIYFTIWDVLLAWGVLSALLFVFLWAAFVVAGRADEAAGCK